MRAYDDEPLPIPPEEARRRFVETNRLIAEAKWRIELAHYARASAIKSDRVR